MLPEISFLGQKVYIYPLLMGIAWAVGYKYSLKLNSEFSLKLPKIKRFLVLLLLSSWLGAKLLFLLTIKTDVTLEAALSFNFWTGGGFVFYGGLIAGFAFTLAYSLRFKVPISRLTILLPALALSHAIGRLGCFFSGCCFGSYCNIGPGFHYPVQLIEATFLFVLSNILAKRLREGKSILSIYFISYSSFRFCIEFLRGDEIRGFGMAGLSTSQLISAFIILLCGIFSYFRSRASR